MDNQSKIDRIIEIENEVFSKLNLKPRKIETIFKFEGGHQVTIHSTKFSMEETKYKSEIE